MISDAESALGASLTETKVDELHSIFDFCNYGYLGDYNSFLALGTYHEKCKEADELKRENVTLRKANETFRLAGQSRCDQHCAPKYTEAVRRRRQV